MVVNLTAFRGIRLTGAQLNPGQFCLINCLVNFALVNSARSNAWLNLPDQIAGNLTAFRGIRLTGAQLNPGQLCLINCLVNSAQSNAWLILPNQMRG